MLNFHTIALFGAHKNEVYSPSTAVGAAHMEFVVIVDTVAFINGLWLSDYLAVISVVLEPVCCAVGFYNATVDIFVKEKISSAPKPCKKKKKKLGPVC